MANNDEKEYQGNAAEKLAKLAGYRLSRNGDTLLTPEFDEALIRLQANPATKIDAAQEREDAQVIASYILTQTSTSCTQDHQNNVALLLNISLSDDDQLAKENYDRASVTVALQQANKLFFHAQRKERRIPVLGMTDFVLS